MDKIEFAEVTIDETGTYLEVWKNGEHHTFLVDDVLDAMMALQIKEFPG